MARLSWGYCASLKNQRRGRNSILSLGVRGRVHSFFEKYKNLKHIAREKLKSWRRPTALSENMWNSLFMPSGRFKDGGAEFLNIVRRGGVHPSIRAEVWPFLLGVYDLNSSIEERKKAITEKREKYEQLRVQCGQLYTQLGIGSIDINTGNQLEDSAYPSSDEIVTARGLPQDSPMASSSNSEPVHSSMKPDNEIVEVSPMEVDQGNVDGKAAKSDKSDARTGLPRAAENFAKWRTNFHRHVLFDVDDWEVYPPGAITENRAHRAAEAVFLEDCEVSKKYYAARLLAILEAYAIHDPRIDCHANMCFLLSPIVIIIDVDYIAFWCFVGLMKKARDNFWFRFNEVGIRSKLSVVSKIIQCKNSEFHGNLVKLGGDELRFLDTTVMVMLKEELGFKKTTCLWEVLWADQAAVSARISNTVQNRLRQLVPPTDDLLLYVIAAAVVQRREQIIAKLRNSGDFKEVCGTMKDKLNVWKLLDDAHDLFIEFHLKIESGEAAKALRLLQTQI